jgi:Big-like domain-containing protein
LPQRIVALVAVALLAAVFPSGDPVGADGRPTGLLAPAEGALFGAHVQASRGAGAYQVVTDLEAKLGRRLAIDHYYRTWEAGFPDGREQWDVAGGRIPMISWGKASATEINTGRWDDLVRLRARGVRTFSQPVLLRWFWEMGGNRNAAEAGSPADFVGAWRHLRRLFAEEGASNAAWVWCPDASDFVSGKAQAYYPGDDQVDWTCADGYNYRHPDRRHTTPRSFEDTFAAFYFWAAQRPHPIMVGEYGVAEDGPGDKAAWITAAREALEHRFPAIGAVVYFHALRDRDGVAYDWRVDSSDSSLSAFSAMGADPWFNPAVVRTLPDTTIEAGPQGTVASSVATFAFAATEPAGGFECRLDGAGFEACTSPRSYPGLADGAHAFEVRALSQTGRPDPTQARREWAVDTTPPSVVAVTPADGATSVAGDSAVSATFSEDLDPATLTAAAFSLEVEATGTAVEARVNYDASARRAVLNPTRPLLPLTAYRARLAAGAVADRVGNKMPRAHLWRFTTAPPVPLPVPP